MVMMVSDTTATRAGVAATFAPAAASARVFSAVRFHTVTSWPSDSSRWAIAAPILPVPAMPIFTRLLLDPGVDTARSRAVKLAGITITAQRSRNHRHMASPKSEVRDGMRIDWDVPIRMDDGLVLRCDVFRPEKDGRHPVLLSYGPYAKGLAFQEGYPSAWQRMVEEHPDVARGSSNQYQNWEVVDPEKWVPEGYACARVDSRGTGRSPGRIDHFSPRETRDFYDCIEWAGTQPWSNGKVGLNGV